MLTPLGVGVLCSYGYLVVPSVSKHLPTFLLFFELCGCHLLAMMLFNLISNIMKKIFVLMVLCTLSMSASAQEVDSLQSNPISIDSLAVKLDKLQHDYDFLYCRSQLDRLQSELENMTLDIRIECNSIMSACFNHSKADVDYYILCKDLYESKKEAFGIKKLNVSFVKSVVSLKMSVLNFSENEKDNLNASLSILEKNLTYIEKLFDSYKNVIDMYKEK